jgi:hypothetical protein
MFGAVVIDERRERLRDGKVRTEPMRKKKLTELCVKLKIPTKPQGLHGGKKFPQGPPTDVSFLGSPLPLSFYPPPSPLR